MLDKIVGFIIVVRWLAWLSNMSLVLILMFLRFTPFIQFLPIVSNVANRKKEQHSEYRTMPQGHNKQQAFAQITKLTINSKQFTWLNNNKQQVHLAKTNNKHT